MNEWLITWSCVDRHNALYYSMQITRGDCLQEVIIRKLQAHENDRSYTNWCVVNAIPLGDGSDHVEIAWNKELRDVLKKTG